MVVSILKRAVAFGLLWLALAGPDGEGLMFGAPAVALAVWTSLRLVPPVRPVRLLRAVLLLPGFLWRSFLGSVDVAVRAFGAPERLRPTWRVWPVDLPDGARVALGAQLSLMPGTLAAGCGRDGTLYVHVLDRAAWQPEEMEADARAWAAMIGKRRT
ncbi:Na+/H+ antiporter subunit E [Rubellimicrobium sp. CFH 75288]|uniref:Na+/H+ antiporter subunit E n=1 Tax=Rubellimicrobium sp. CFH 75288 TaxID=2697034 RepID=UPI001412BC8B|nr:Na+/H+ antiporter subunit E [Rubellimicrobium sp. CFH 75288]NAZ36785.1 sodium:proton antiporter [Rubellimicrobium sp. CFH 75288]